MANPTVAAGFPKAFLDFAASRGADRQTLLERSRIRQDDLDEQDNRVPLSSYVALLKAGIELCDEPALALLFGEAVGMPDVSIVGLIGAAVGSAEEGRRQVSRYARLMFDEDDGGASERVEFVRENGNVWVKFTSPVYAENPLVTESGFARAVCGMRAMFEAECVPVPQPVPKAIHFTYEEPAHRAEYDRVFGVPLVFGSHANAFLMGGEFLSLSLPGKNPYLSRILTAHAEGLLEKLENSKSTSGRVESLLAPMLPTGAASVDAIAKELGVSRQTLFRRLKAEGVTFEQVLDELRRKLALQYLGAKRASVGETAYLLGFSDPAAFSRAFKRWTGTSPRAALASTAGKE